MIINEHLLEADGLTKPEIETVKQYVKEAGNIDNTATLIHINGRLVCVCRTVAFAIQVVRPDVMNLPNSDEAWIMAHSQELQKELVAMAQRGEPCPASHTLLGRALSMFTEE